ncbi:hypothetical protein NM688_g9440 [Phlebia brevispora]|uniref:Uncharacterized protein n=1 Tax=Phlebia brevispora TaxID=194682 RepID=A0ACC1RFT0_9APHY|nr:hypothetical protein NM688_g9440 [Phlebia brevispora]
MGMVLPASFWHLVAAGMVACAFAVAFRWTKQRRSGSGALDTRKDSTQYVKAVPLLDKEQATAPRAPGEWTAVEFHYPRIEPFREKLEDIKPIPYRPFKWGEYFVTMGIRSMHWDEWIELDRDFFHYFKIREQRINTRRDRLVRTLPTTPGVVEGGHAGATELVEELAEYLSARFPTIYTVVRHDPEKNTSGWYGKPSIKEITIVPLQKTYVLAQEDPMVISALLVQEDLAIMVEGK